MTNVEIAGLALSVLAIILGYNFRFRQIDRKLEKISAKVEKVPAEIDEIMSKKQALALLRIYIKLNQSTIKDRIFEERLSELLYKPKDNQTEINRILLHSARSVIKDTRPMTADFLLPNWIPFFVFLEKHNDELNGQIKRSVERVQVLFQKYLMKKELNRGDVSDFLHDLHSEITSIGEHTEEYLKREIDKIY